MDSKCPNQTAESRYADLALYCRHVELWDSALVISKSLYETAGIAVDI